MEAKCQYWDKSTWGSSTDHTLDFSACLSHFIMTTGLNIWFKEEREMRMKASWVSVHWLLKNFTILKWFFGHVLITLPCIIMNRLQIFFGKKPKQNPNKLKQPFVIKKDSNL